jgi:hypothetical protein
MKNISKFILIFALLFSHNAVALTSSINPSVPASNSALTSSPVRSNFLAAYNDINTIYGILGGIGSFGTLAQQNANNVAITGGDISGVTLGQNAFVSGEFSSIDYFGPNCGGSVLFTLSSTVSCDPNFTYDGAGVLDLNSVANGTHFWLNLSSGVSIQKADTTGNGIFDSSLCNSGYCGQFWRTYNQSSGGNYTYISLNTSGGTPSVPLYLAANDVVGRIDFATSKPASGNLAHIITKASATQGAGSSPGNLCVYTTPNGATENITTPGICQSSTGGVTIGAPTGGDKGINTINATTVYQNNVQVLSAAGTGISTSGATVNSNAESTITFQPGGLTAITNTKSGFVKMVKASTVDNITASAQSFTCSVNPAVTLYECGTDATCASPTAIGTATVTASGQAFSGSPSGSITAGDYLAWAISAGTCTVLDISATAQVHSN